MNRLKGTFVYFSAQEGILRLYVRLSGGSGFKNTESQMLSVLLLENSVFLEPFLNKTLEIGFKESNVIVGLELKGVHNTFKSEILGIEMDTLFARLVLKTDVISNVITALCPLDFVAQNVLKKGDCVEWHIPENAVMLYV
ncbi:molybdate ABC transporter [Helicobacter turcicus]|uniref:Molybdate ABC transporter n=1 Tax=Helicobacter turcicus TaxID=2867412 RepID=A0ABS7JM57_9HELI|nr:molybdate ABC transporter [Helicobacter turcicus]MBX7490484.1 molybdate ABC transporter [Helicobacter turcicus]MBX7545344.1 molybdate ABC transporter [Helicobacter turcicus]